MTKVLKVILWDKDVAALSWNADKEYGVIEFFDSFVKDGLNIAPILMPIDDMLRGERIFSFPNLRHKTFKGLPGLISDSLPDDYGNTVIDEWFASRQIFTQITPLDRLCYIGKRGMGALEYQPATEDLFLDDSARIEIAELTELANMVLNDRAQFQHKVENSKDEIIDILKVGTSAGGAKPKAIIAYNDGTKELRSGQVKAPEGFSYWLLKFDGVEAKKISDNPAGIGKIEYAYYKMALDCGISMTECRLLHEGDKSHFMTKRFDRTDEGEKLHTQTLCGIAHFDRDERYSYEQMFQTMRQLYLTYPEMEQMFRRMVFNVVARNNDDHTKNHSFIMDKKGKWTLAPAYDLCFSYSPSGKWTNQHQLSLNGKRDNFTKEDLTIVGEKSDIRDAKNIIEHISTIVSQWKYYAKDADVKKEHSQQINNMLLLL